MDHPGTDLPLLEQSSSKRVIAAGGIGVLLVGMAVAAILWFRRGDKSPVVTLPKTTQTITVEVLNGTDRRGLARQVTRVLREEGVDVIYFGSAEDSSHLTQILVRRGEKAKGEELRRLLGVGRVVSKPDSLRRLDLTLILGDDYVLPKGWLPL